MKKMLVLLMVFAICGSALANFSASVLENGNYQGDIEAMAITGTAVNYYNFSNWNYNWRLADFDS